MSDIQMKESGTGSKSRAASDRNSLTERVENLYQITAEISRLVLGEKKLLLKQLNYNSIFPNTATGWQTGE